MAYEDEFRTDGFENEHSEQTGEFVEHGEFFGIEEKEEFDERFFHSDEYNRKFLAGSHKKDIDFENSKEPESPALIPDENIKKVSFFKKAAETVKMGAALVAASAVFVTGAPETFGGIFSPISKDDTLVVHSHIEAGEWTTTVCATCLAEGEQIIVCSDCGETLRKETIPVLEHVPGLWETSVYATCKDDGMEIRLCTLCETVLESRIIAAGEHLAGDWIVDIEHTCETEGHRHTECVACGTIILEETISASHTEIIVPAKEATCSSEGLTEGKRCSVCGKIIVPQEKIAAIPHTEVSDPEVPGTCSNPGLTEGSHCSVCGEVIVAQKTVTVPHTPVTDRGYSADCYSTGLTEGSHCSVCGEVIVAQNVIPTSHDPVTVPGYASTCIEHGLSDSSYCRRCQVQITETTELPLAAHTEVVVPGQAPTCVDMGYGEYIYCGVCQTTIQVAQQLPVEPDAHSWVSADTFEGLICQYCGATQS